MSINYVASNGILIEGIYKNKSFKIKFSDIQPYWQFANEEDFESGKAKIYNQILVANIIVSNGQGVLIFVWDLENNKLVSCFEEEYCIDFVLKNEAVYSLCYVSYWGTSPYFQLTRTDIKSKKSEIVLKQFPFDTSIYNGDLGTVSIRFKTNNSLAISFGEREYISRVEY